jgi:hypothetical protein
VRTVHLLYMHFKNAKIAMKYTGKVQETCKKHAENMQKTCRKHDLMMKDEICT